MPKVLALLLDAAEPSLIERWTADGSLPNLQRLMQRGAYGRLHSLAGWISEAVPYAFFSGQNPAATGLHNYSMWDPASMRARQPSPDWLPYQPFWRSFRAGGPRAVILDPSNVYPPQPFNGVEVIGWATQHAFAPYQSFPSELAAWIHANFGSSLQPDEMYGLPSKRAFLRERDWLLELNRRFEGLCLALMQKEQWDLFLASNFTLHQAGHRLWNTVNIKGALSDTEHEGLNDSLRQVYIACDRAVGRLVGAVDSSTRVLVISLHGMGRNQSRTWIFPEMLRRVLGAPVSSPTLLQRLRRLLPVEWRHVVKSRLPHQSRRDLSRFWQREGYDWKSTRAFALQSDTQAWVRINLRGREKLGIVEPGLEYEELCQSITDGLMNFVDADTGSPLVKDVVRPRQVLAGEHLENLPDMIVRWTDSPASEHREVLSERFGIIPWPTPGRNPDGRSGNHRAGGMLNATGPGIRGGTQVAGHILDLAPTILSLLGLPVPPEMEGRPLALVQ